MKGQVGVDIRPIAIGEMLRRIAAKYLCRVNRKEFLQYLTPTNQLGVGARCGIESIIHAVCLEIQILSCFKLTLRTLLTISLVDIFWTL